MRAWRAVLLILFVAGALAAPAAQDGTPLVTLTPFAETDGLHPGSSGRLALQVEMLEGLKPGLPALKHVVLVGGTGPTADTVQFPLIVNAVLGTKMKIIDGYPGGNDVVLAMERGEVTGRCGWLSAPMYSSPNRSVLGRL